MEQFIAGALCMGVGVCFGAIANAMGVALSSKNTNKES